MISLRQGEQVLGWNQEKLFVPASTAKLFTTAAALVRLGPDFTYRTTIESTAPMDENGGVHGDLILVGRGDPNLSARSLPYEGRTERNGSPTKVLEELAGEVVARGVRQVDGDLIADDTYFVHQPYGQGWAVGDLVWGYGAPVAALSVNDNVITLTILPGEHPGDAAAVRLAPAGSDYPVVNRTVTVARGRQQAERKISVDRKLGSRVLQLWGRIPENDAGLVESVAMDDPPALAGELLRQELERRGVVIKGKSVVRHQEPIEVPDLMGTPQPPTAAPATVFASHQSAPLVESLKIINKVSQNLHAEMLLRTLGRERRHVGSTEAGLEEVSGFLKEIGIEESRVALRDGSGLSRQNLASPAAMVALLRAMYNSPLRSAWMDSLPVAGQDGSLTNRLRDPAVAGRVRAKTGNESGIAALAGYMDGRNNETLAFAIFVNNHNLTSAGITGLMDRIVEEIARSR